MNLSAATWRTSSYSNAGNNNCVEVGSAGLLVGVRDTKARDRGALAFGRSAFAALIHAVRRDELAR